MNGSRRIKASCWLPLAAYGATAWYVGRFDGWGAWAAAPMFLPALLFSAVMGLAGLALWLRRRRAGLSDPWLAAAALLAGLPCLYLLGRALVV